MAPQSRKKFKSPDLKKNAASKKMTFDGVILSELDDQSGSEEVKHGNGSSQDEDHDSKNRTFTFNIEEGLPKVNETCASAEVSPVKHSPQDKEMQDLKDQLKKDLIKVQSPVQKEPELDDEQ